MAEDHGQRAKHRKRHRGEEQDAMLEFAVKIRRQRHGGCDRQQVDGGDPLHSSSVHVEFPHELWEQHRHHGFGEDADEGERADRHDGADEFAGNAFVHSLVCERPRAADIIHGCRMLFFHISLSAHFFRRPCAMPFPTRTNTHQTSCARR